MAATESTMLDLGTLAPAFQLPTFDGELISRDDFKNAPALVIAFICSHCPFVKHIRSELAGFAREYQDKGVAVVAINSNDLDAYPQDGPDGMREEARGVGYTFPYLLDESQAIAKAYRAACTPDFFLFDSTQRLVYRGQFDASRPGNDVPVTGADLRSAADAVLDRAPVPQDQKPSIGCNIKWKKEHSDS
jgi:thiol-disulfide isomerase/thioredoxin